MRWCTCPRSEAAALAHGGSWTNEDCPQHGREAQEWEAQEARANRNLDMMIDGLDSPADLEDHDATEEDA